MDIVDYIKSLVDTVSRHFSTSDIYVTPMFPPPQVKVKVRPIRCLSKYMNIEDVEIIGRWLYIRDRKVILFF